MNPIIIEVSGVPKGQPRARAFYKPGLGVRVYDPGSAEGWKGQIALAARPVLPVTPLDGPIRVDIDFRFPRPKGHYGAGKNAAVLKPGAPSWHTAKPDRDNAEKAVLDCLTQLGAWRDDAQACCGEVTKRYGDTAGATIKITKLEENHV